MVPALVDVPSSFTHQDIEHLIGRIMPNGAPHKALMRSKASVKQVIHNLGLVVFDSCVKAIAKSSE